MLRPRRGGRRRRRVRLRRSSAGRSGRWPRRRARRSSSAWRATSASTAPVLPWHTLRGAHRRARRRARRRRGRDRQGRARRHAARPDRGRRGARGPRRRLDDMPHKHNPVAAVSALGCAEQAPGLVATLLAAMVQEHERAAGAWHSEWRPLTELLTADRLRRGWLRDVAGRPRGRRRAHAREPRRQRRRRRRRRTRRPEHWSTDDPAPHRHRPRGRARRSCSRTRSAPRSRCGTRRSTRWPSASGVVRYDTRGHGELGHAAGPYSIDDVGGDVIDLLDHLGVERAHFAGLSLGGMTGMWLGDPRARADRPARPAVHLAADGPAADVGRPRQDRARAGHAGDRRRHAGALADRGLPRDSTTSRGCARCSSASATRATRTAARSSSTWTSTASLPQHRRAHAGDRRRAGPGHAAAPSTPR